MNKKLLVTIVISVGLLVVGTVLAFVGYFPGGGKDYFLEQSQGQEVVAADLVNGGAMDLDAFQSVSLDASYGDLTLVYGDAYGITLENFTKETLPVYRVENGTLYVANPKNGNGLNLTVNFNTVVPKTTITVPKDTSFQNLDFHLGDGDLFLDTINAAILSVNNSYGDVTLKNITAPTVKITAGDSDMVLDTLKADTLEISNDYGATSLTAAESGAITMSGADGEISFDGVTTEKLKLSNNYGNINISNSNLSNGEVTLSDGDFRATATTWKNSTMENSYGATVLDGVTGENLTFSAEDGSVTVKNTNLSNASVTLESGDLNVSATTWKGGAIKDNYGEVSLQKVTGSDFSLTTEDGGITVADSAISNGDASLESGDFTADATAWNGGSVKSNYGAVKMSGKLLGAIEITSADGNIDLAIDGAEADYIYTFVSENDDILLNGKTYTGTLTVKGDLPNSIKATTESGGIDVVFAQ